MTQDKGSSNPTHKVCTCGICKCTCNATFRRDQLQAIHTTKNYEEWCSTNGNGGSPDKKKNCNDVTCLKQSIMREINQTVVDTAKDAIVDVMQSLPMKCVQYYDNLHQHHPIKSHTSQYPGDFNPVEVQQTIERSLVVTGLALAKDPTIAGHVGLKNELREEMGGRPTNMLVNTGQTVGQYQHDMKKRRASRNNLVDLYSSSDDKVTKKSMQELAKMRKRIMMKFMVLHKKEKNVDVKHKIKYAMKSLDESMDERNKTIDFILKVHTADIETFDSMDAATTMIEFADDETK